MSRESFRASVVCFGNAAAICQHFNTIDVEVCYTRSGDFTWRVSDCEELVARPE